MGNCPHRKYLPLLLEMVRNGTIDPREFLTRQEPLMDAIQAYKEFDRRSPGWVKVELQPQTH
jgi:threonine dehydrogenase-like Zn-dependent dehydrogenase